MWPHLHLLAQPLANLTCISMDLGSILVIIWGHLTTENEGSNPSAIHSMQAWAQNKAFPLTLLDVPCWFAIQHCGQQKLQVEVLHVPPWFAHKHPPNIARISLHVAGGLYHVGLHRNMVRYNFMAKWLGEIATKKRHQGEISPHPILGEASYPTLEGSAALDLGKKRQNTTTKLHADQGWKTWKSF